MYIEPTLSRWLVTLGLLWCISIGVAQAHPMPNTLVNIVVQPDHLSWTIKIPVVDFEIAFADTLTESTAAKLPAYFEQHIRVTSATGALWQQHFDGYSISKATDANVGEYRELNVTLTWRPTPTGDVRNFVILYDAVMHEIRNHEALVYVQQDWENGIHETAVEAGVVRMDVPTNTIPPLPITLAQGSRWQGFRSMLSLGMHHIAEGTDHLLFLLTLLLPAPLQVAGRRWAGYGGRRYTLWRLLTIVTAFTIGHSLTLLLGTMGWIPFSTYWIEVFIALSIAVSALHALSPLFYTRESYIAAGFGLIHGLAFSNTLRPLQLSTAQLALSLFGFNLGIELMQLLIVGVFLPVILWLSRTRFYSPLRVAGAVVAIALALLWAYERASGEALW